MAAALLQRVRAALEAAPLVVAGFEERVAVGPEELARFHIPLAELVAERAEKAGGRFLVAIAGVPGSGKSVFAALMERIIGAVRPDLGVKAIGIDGYHYPNAWLDARPAPPDAPEGATLRLYKGAPFTFDVARLAADLRRLREASEPVALPDYDRTLHDPVEGRLLVEPRHRLILVEGNWLLYREDGWEAVAELFGLSIFLSLPPGANREPLLARHRRGGRTREEAIAHFERVDRPNTERIAATREHADIVVRLDAHHHVEALRLRQR